MWKIVSALILQISVGLVILWVVNDLQSKPYMDEIFHIPQANRYCSGNMSGWDPMITTLPGLYAMSASLLVPIAVMLHLPVSDVCNTFTLRSINLGLMVANVFVLYMLSCTLNGRRKKDVAVLNAVSIGCFPVLYQFSFLYYTDPGSVFWVLVMYLACLKEAHKTAAICGLAAVLFRQTNIVWVVYMAGVACETDIILWLVSRQKQIENDVHSMVAVKYVIKEIIHSFAKSRKDLFHLISNVVQKIIPYVIIVVIFLVFVVINDGIVVGDKSHHQACVNFPQIYYFLCTCMIFGWWYMISIEKVKSCFTYIVNHLFSVSLFVAVSAYVVSRFTYVHEYLLADNRHYTFYVWSKIYRRHELMKFLLIPVYFFAYYNFSMTLNHKTFLWKIFFSVCLAFNIVPQKLLEFRYFVIPFYIWRLNIRQPSKYILWLEIVLFNVVNGITLYMFLFKPFKWFDSDELQRFMW